MNKQVEFVGTIIRQTYDSENYKMYAVDVDKNKYPELKHTKYGNVCIGGNLHTLVPETEYFIKATERNSQKGYSYQVINIKKTALKSEHDVYMFLREILTEKQAAELYREYPNIVEMVVNNQTDQVDLKKLYGIGERTFNVIKRKIIENYALFDIINEFKGVLTMSMLKKLYDAYPSIEKIRSEMRIRPYTCLCSLSRVGFKTADKLLLDMEKEKVVQFGFDLATSKERCMACIMNFLDENETNGNTKMSIPELRKQVMKLTPACAPHFVECLNGNNNIYYNKETMDIALRRTYETEKFIADTLLDVVNKKHKWNINWESYRNKGEYPLSDEQLKALELVCNNQVSILCGFAGSGKTATTNTLIQMLVDNHKTFTLMASTGRAAKVLQSYTGMPASTIHRGYGYTPPNDWGYNRDCKIETDIIIVDEVSMCDVFLFYRLLDGIDFDTTKLFIIGDSAQLCSVGAGNLLNDLINSKSIPVASLTKIFRYNEGGLMQVATDVRNGKQLNLLKSDKYVSIGENKDFSFLQSSNNNIIQNVSNLYKGLLGKDIPVTDIMILSAQNKGDYGTVKINNELQKMANENYNCNKFLKIGETVYYEGDLVIQTKNNYHAQLYLDDCDDFMFDEPKETMVANGETMTILEINPLYTILDLDGIKLKYYRADMDDVSLAYSITCHKSQGGSAKIIIFVVPTSHTFMLSSNLLYVGLTRTKEKCFVIGDLTTINRAIKKKEEIRRNTFLLDLLK